MKFGLREIIDTVFKAANNMKIGSKEFKKGQPVFLIDSANAASMEQATTAVYANGGRGYARLISWEGEKTITFTITDALLSPMGIAILAGAGLFQGTGGKVHAHKFNYFYVDESGAIDLSNELATGEKVCDSAPIFVTEVEDGSFTDMVTGLTVSEDGLKLTGATGSKGKQVFVDFYVVKEDTAVSELVLSPDTFGGNFYVEGITLARKQSDGLDMPMTFTMPNVKIQSNMTIAMAPNGDPSTFDFVMDALPGYTFFDRTKKVQCVMQIINETVSAATDKSVMGYKEDQNIDIVAGDSTAAVEVSE